MAKYLGTVLVLAAACGDGPPDTSAPRVTIDVDGVNALVPGELKATLVFEKREIVEDRGRDKVTYTLAAPKDWGPGDMAMFAKLEPRTGWGRRTEIDVGSNCNGRCEPKDWAVVSEKVNFAQLRDGTIIKDEVGKTSHLMIVEKDTTTYVQYAWWKAGGARYFTCSATLEPSFGEPPAVPVRAAAPAFAKACQAVQITGR